MLTEVGRSSGREQMLLTEVGRSSGREQMLTEVGRSSGREQIRQRTTDADRMLTEVGSGPVIRQRTDADSHQANRC